MIKSIMTVMIMMMMIMKMSILKMADNNISIRDDNNISNDNNISQSRMKGENLMTEKLLKKLNSR